MKMAKIAAESKIEYTKMLDSQSLERAEAFASKLSKNYSQLYAYAEEAREIYREIRKQYSENLELADKIFDNFKKKASFYLPTNLRNFVLDLATNTVDYEPHFWQLFASKMCTWGLPLSKVRDLAKLENRYELEELLKSEDKPAGKEINAILPKKPLKSIAPNKAYAEEYVALVANKLGLSEDQQGWLKSEIIKQFNKGEEEKKSTNHIIKALVALSRGDMNFGTNQLKIPKSAILKIFNDAGKHMFDYEHHVQDLKEENQKLHERQEELDSKYRQTQFRLTDLENNFNNKIVEEIRAQLAKLNIGENKSIPAGT